MQIKSKYTGALAGAAVSLLFAPFTVERSFSAVPPEHAPTKAAADAMSPTLSESIGKLPLRFERTAHHGDDTPQFISRGPGYTVSLADNEAVVTVMKSSQAPPYERNADTVRMQLLGSNRKVRPVAGQQLRGTSNYYIGNDDSKWRTDVPGYGNVKYPDIYPGIDLVYYGNQRQLEYDFVVSPGADPHAIRFAVSGSLAIDSQGDLVAHSGTSDVRFHKPLVYQSDADGRRTPVEGQFSLGRSGQISFEVAEYDHSKPLTIDPTLAYSTLLGGGANDGIFDIAVDGSGNAYLAGWTSSVDFPTIPTQSFPAKTISGSSVCFVAKIIADGSALVYSSYLGGTGGEYCSGIGVDAAGNAYVAGVSSSTDFPVKNALQSSARGGGDGFVTKLNTDGSLGYSTYLGGSLSDSATSIAVSSSGSAYVVGETYSVDFPTTPGLNTVHTGSNGTAFVTSIDPNGALIFSTYLGGSGVYPYDEDYAKKVALDPAGNVYVTGATSSINFPTINAAQPALASVAPDHDAFLSKLSADGSTLLYSTYLGGSDFDSGHGLAVDAAGNAYVSGRTCSTNFPLKNPLQSTISVCDGFVTKIDTTQSGASSLVFSTLLGGDIPVTALYVQSADAVALDASNNAVYVVGYTAATDFPTTPDALNPSGTGAPSAFVAKINPSLPRLQYSSYLGGSNTQFPQAVAVAGGSVYVAGYTDSSDFPTTSGALQPTLKGSSDGFLVKMAFVPGVMLPNLIARNVAISSSTFANFTVTPTDGFNQAVTFDVSRQPAGMTVSPTRFTLVPSMGSVTQALDFVLGPSIIPGRYTFGISEEGSSDTVGVALTVSATTAGAVKVVSAIQSASCMSSAAVASAIKASLAQAQRYASNGQIQLAQNTYSALLAYIRTLQSKQLLSTTCQIGGVTFSPAAVLTFDIRALSAYL
jgi:hypothetical protein